MTASRFSPQSRQASTQWFIFTSALVLLVAAILRLVNISLYPQGFHYDESVNLIVSREIAFLGARPFPVFAAFNGREVFYYYVNALAMLGIGEHIFTLHFVSVMMNMIAIATTVGIGHVAFGKQRGWIIGLLAAGVFTVSFPQLFLSRQAFRSISEPMLQGLAIWTLFMAYRQRTQRGWLSWGVVSGIFAGLVVYTYMASRLFPLWYGIIVGAMWLFDGKHRSLRFKQGIIVLVVMIVVALPIINYYLEHRDVFNDRLSQLSPTDESITYGKSVRLHLEMFFIKGDPLLRYNQSGQSYFPLSLGLFMVVGWLASLWHIFQDGDAFRRSAYLIIALSPLMVIPSVLAINGLPPSHMRSVGMVPLVFFLPAIGINNVWNLVTSRFVQPTVKPALAYTLGLGTLVVFAILIGNRYERWASIPDLYYQNDGDMVTAGDWLETHSNNQTLMYVSSQHYDHPSLLIHSLPGDNITFLLGDRLFWPPSDRSAYLVEIANAPFSAELKAWLSDFKVLTTLKNERGDYAATIYEWQPKQGTLMAPSKEAVGGWLSLVDQELPPAISGQAVTVTTLWDILATPTFADLRPIFNLQTLDGDQIARVDPYTQHANKWRAGETLVQQAKLVLPIGTPPGDYLLRVTWVSQSADQYVGRIDENGNFAGIWTDIGTLSVSRPSHFPEPSALDIDLNNSQDIGNGIHLLHSGLNKTDYLPGETINLNLYWQAMVVQSNTATPLQFLARSGNSEIELWSGQPVMDSYPFAEWVEGELVIDRHRWPIPTDLRDGGYSLVLRVNNLELALGKITVAPLDRKFELPTIENPLDYTLGDRIGLRGYDISSTDLVRGEMLDLTLYWQALAINDLLLTVFVHVAGADGVNLTQQDVKPRNNTYPVALWLVNEVVDDDYTLVIPQDAPSGTYEIRVGMYLQENGQRLSVVDENGNVAGDYIVLTSVTIH